LSRQYLDLNKPLYERRLAIISGSEKPTPEEIQAGEEQSVKDDPEYKKLPKDSPDTAPIPEFWLTALRNHVGTSDIITDRDAGALKHLVDIRVTYTTPKPGFKLTNSLRTKSWRRRIIIRRRLDTRATSSTIVPSEQRSSGRRTRI